MSELFTEAFLESQQATRPHLDVRIYAAAVREMNTRYPVRNPNGLLIHWLNCADRAMRPKLAADRAAAAAELESYAVFWEHLLRLVSMRGLTPHQIAACLAKGRVEGFPRLSAPLIARLQQLGNDWAPTPDAPAPSLAPERADADPESRQTRRSHAALHA